MWGAIIGDLAGSIYEFDQSKKVHSLNVSNIFSNQSFYSDDTILTIAILDAILNNRNYEQFLKKYAKKYESNIPKDIPYFKGMFSPRFTKWYNSNSIGNSTGNGAMMRISPIGFMFNSEEEVKENAKLATIPSHNTKEATDSATLIALIVFYARKGLTKEQIVEKLSLEYKYKPFQKFNSTCNETVENCLFALFEANTFEDAIKLVISFGGDTDTNACIVGSMAEALYGIDEKLILKAQKYIPEEFTKKLVLAYTKYIN